jgi:hypothetical protein
MVSSRETISRELERHHSSELAKAGRGLRPWFARPAIWVGAIAAGGIVWLLVSIFLSATPG